MTKGEEIVVGSLRPDSKSYEKDREFVDRFRWLTYDELLEELASNMKGIFRLGDGVIYCQSKAKDKDGNEYTFRKSWWSSYKDCFRDEDETEEEWKKRLAKEMIDSLKRGKISSRGFKAWDDNVFGIGGQKSSGPVNERKALKEDTDFAVRLLNGICKWALEAFDEGDGPESIAEEAVELFERDIKEYRYDLAEYFDLDDLERIEDAVKKLVAEEIREELKR